MRPQGTVLFDDTLTVHPVIAEAKKQQRQKQELIRLRREARPERPLLNKDRYPNLYAQWLAGKERGYTKLPNCPVCREAVIHWNEPAHECPGFKPMYEEHDQEWHDRKDAEREAIREAKRGNGIYCDGCGELVESEDDARWHDEHCERDPESDSWRIHHIAVNGDEDDLSGYEDPPEEDWCDEDDGDPMWE
jgi:hypothetical protein